ncbi:sodium:glutamate symporter [Micrococcus luteus]|nr:sodium:glutamate symporter [Micrococcus luteus]MBS9536837.1 sodium:glutamate symporter [Micrococcus luteus]
MQEQFTAWSVLVDAGLIGALLAVGTLARAVITPLQTLMIPASVIAGILGLALGPNGLGWLPFSPQLGTYGSILIVIVFVCIALTDDFDVRKIGRPVGAFASYGVLIYSSQVAIGALVTLVLLQPLFDAPDSFAALLFAGWAGGFGSAAAVGQAYAANGDATVTSLAYTSATVGMIVGVVGGIIQAKIGAQRGHAREFAGLTSIPEELRTGVLNQVEERPVIGRHTFSAASVESLAFQVGVVAMIAAAAHGVVSWITAVWPSVVGEDGPQLIIPAFAIAFLLGLIARVLFQATKTAKFLDPGSLNSVSVTATDILIVCGIAAIAPTVVVDYWQPLLLLFVIGLALALFLGIVVAPRVMTDAWFEKQLFTWGWATGAVATGVAMLRIVDPKLKSGTMEQFGVAYIPVVPVEIAAVSFVPLLLIAGPSWAVVGIWGAIAIIAIIAAVWLRRTDPGRRTPAQQAVRASSR